MQFQIQRDTKTNGWLVFFMKWGKGRFPKVPTLEPGGLFKEYDLHKVQSLEIPLVQMDALSVNYWLTKFVQEVAKPSKERYPPKTLFIVMCFSCFINMQIKFASVFEIISKHAVVFSSFFVGFLNPST